MRIRAQLLAAVAAAGVVTALVAAGLLYVNRQGFEALQAQSDTQEVARDAASLVTLTLEYAAVGGNRPATQWKLRHAQLMATVDEALRRSPEPSASLERLRRDSQDLPALFGKLEEISQEPASDWVQRRKLLMIERLLAETQEMTESRFRWATEVGQKHSQEQQTYQWMVVGAPAALLALLAGLCVVVGRRILSPLVRLQQTADAIRTGDLAARCASDAQDGIGEVARAVDAMTTALQREHGKLIALNERLHTESELRRASEMRNAHSERFLRLVTDNLPVLVSYIDHAQRFRFANRAYRD